MEFDFNNKIDIQAEKSIFNEAILGSTPKAEMIGATESKAAIDFAPTEYMASSSKLEAFGLENVPFKSVTPDKSPFSLENMASLSQSGDESNFDLSSIKTTNISAPPISFNLNDSMTPGPVVGSPAEFKAIVPTEDPFEKTQEQTKNLEKLLNTQVMPSVQKIANEVNSLGIKEKNQRSMTEERPTVKPENLIFYDRSQKASNPPAWA